MESFAELFNSDVFTAAVSGLAVSVIVIKLASGKATIAPDTEDQNASNKGEVHLGEPDKIPPIPPQHNDDKLCSEKTISDDAPVQKIPVINESHALKKLAPLQSLLGLTDEQMSKAIKDTNTEIAQDPSKLDSADSLSRSVDLFVFICALLFGFYVINIYTHGDLGRMVLGFFPVEAASLNLANYLRDFR